jgi:hypothetical protein
MYSRTQGYTRTVENSEKNFYLPVLVCNNKIPIEKNNKIFSRSCKMAERDADYNYLSPRPISTSNCSSAKDREESAAEFERHMLSRPPYPPPSGPGTAIVPMCQEEKANPPRPSPPLSRCVGRYQMIDPAPPCADKCLPNRVLIGSYPYMLENTFIPPDAIMFHPKDITLDRSLFNSSTKQKFKKRPDPTCTT